MSSQETSAGVREGAKALIVHAFGDDALSTLKKKFTKYGATTPHEMLAHLRAKTCIKLTTLEKFKLKNRLLAKEYDPASEITVYFKYLDNTINKLEARSIKVTDQDKLNATVTQMWEWE